MGVYLKEIFGKDRAKFPDFVQENLKEANELSVSPADVNTVFQSFGAQDKLVYPPVPVRKDLLEKRRLQSLSVPVSAGFDDDIVSVRPIEEAISSASAQKENFRISQTVNTPITKEHPLYNLKDKLEAEAVILEDKYFGAHFFGFGGSLVKGMNIQFIDRCEMKRKNPNVSPTYNTDEHRIEMVCKILPAFDQLISDERLVTAFNQRNEHFAYNLTCKKEDNVLSKVQDRCDRRYIVTDNSGASIGEVLVSGLVKHRLHVCIPGADEQQLKAILFLFGLEGLIEKSTETDIERMKMLYLFRGLHPGEALTLERDSETYQLDLKELEGRIIEKAPTMKDSFEKLLGAITMEEIIPGRYRMKLPYLSAVAKANGCKGLIHNLGDISVVPAISRRIIDDGYLFSGEIRDLYGITSCGGMSVAQDYQYGGRDSVFVRALTEGCVPDGHLVFNPELLDRFTYQYFKDQYGSRHFDPEAYTRNEWGESFEYSYQNRPSLGEFFEESKVRPLRLENEIMVKDAIPIKFLDHIFVWEKEEALLSALEVRRFGDRQYIKVGDRYIKPKHFIKTRQNTPDYDGSCTNGSHFKTEQQLTAISRLFLSIIKKDPDSSKKERMEGSRSPRIGSRSPRLGSRSPRKSRSPRGSLVTRDERTWKNEERPWKSYRVFYNDAGEKLFEKTSTTIECTAENAGGSLARYLTRGLVPVPLIQKNEGEGEMSKTVQPYLELTMFDSNFQPNALTIRQHKQLFAHMIADYVIHNNDCHYDQFGIDLNGNVIALDKGQSFKTLVKPSLGNVKSFEDWIKAVDNRTYRSFSKHLKDNPHLLPQMFASTEVKGCFSRVKGLREKDFEHYICRYVEACCLNQDKKGQLCSELEERKNVVQNEIFAYFGQESKRLVA